jgi:methyl-accepting chemotaxis protein
VSDLIGEITASSTEQRDGIGQVNQAVTTSTR